MDVEDPLVIERMLRLRTPAIFAEKIFLEINLVIASRHFVRNSSIMRSLVVLVALGSIISASAETDLPIYTDSLSVGFQDGGHAAHDLVNTSPVHSGLYSISVNATGRWETLSFDHGELDTTPFESLSLWVHGGTNGGQRLQVQAALGRVNPPANVYYRFTLSSNTWRQIIIPLSSIGAADKTNLTAFWIQLTPGGGSDPFYLDDMWLKAKPSLAVAPVVVTSNLAPAITTATLPSGQEPHWTVLIWCVVVVLVLIAVLLIGLLVTLRRSHATTSKSLELASHRTGGLLSSQTAEPSQTREQVARELAEFAKQAFVQELLAQRSKLAVVQQQAQAELAALEQRLAALQLPLKERIRAYEERISELEKSLETRDEELRQMIQATLTLVRQRLEAEKGREPDISRFN